MCGDELKHNFNDYIIDVNRIKSLPTNSTSDKDKESDTMIYKYN